MAPQEQDYEHNVDLVCEGGGVRGIGLAGAYSVLEERGRAAESCRHLGGRDHGGFDRSRLLVCRAEEHHLRPRLPPVRGQGLGEPDPGDRALAIRIEEGVYRGDDFLQWIRGLLADKCIHTFADLRTGWDDPKDWSRLQVIASDINSRQLLVLRAAAGSC